jgi:hypothetical protein
VLGVALAGLAGVIFLGILSSRESGEDIEIGHRDVLIAVAAMLIVPPLLETLGAYLTLGGFSVSLLVLIGRVPVVRAVAASAVGMVAIWYFFKVLLGLQLPPGPF